MTDQHAGGFSPWDHLPPAMLDAMAAADRAEERQWQLEQAERAERAWERQQEAQRQERLFEYLHGHSRSEWMQAMAMSREAKANRDAAAELGSVGRAAIIGPYGDLIEPAGQIQPTRQSNSPGAQLARAQQDPGKRAFMQRMVADLERRSGGRRGTIRRSDSGDGVTCLDCIEQGATPDESFLLHHDPERPLPERRVPDSPTSASRRAWSGTGWPAEISR